MKGQYIKIVVAASLIMCTMIAGTVSFGFFMEPVTSDLGLERGKFSVYFSLISIVGAITLPFYGRMISRFGTRPPRYRMRSLDRRCDGRLISMP